MPLGGLPEAVSTTSCLIPKAFLPISAINDIAESTQRELIRIAREAFPPDTLLTIRDLLPADLGLTNQEWTETSSTDNSFTDTSIAAKSIPAETFVAIYGVGILSSTLLSGDLIAKPPVSAFRVTVGAAKVAQWSLYPLWKNTAYILTSTVDTAAAAFADPLYGICQSPVIIAGNGVITIEMYNIEASIVFKPVLLGYTVEKQNKTLNP